MDLISSIGSLGSISSVGSTDCICFYICIFNIFHTWKRKSASHSCSAFKRECFKLQIVTFQCKFQLFNISPSVSETARTSTQLGIRLQFFVKTKMGSPESIQDDPSGITEYQRLLICRGLCLCCILNVMLHAWWWKLFKYTELHWNVAARIIELLALWFHYYILAGSFCSSGFSCFYGSSCSSGSFGSYGSFGASGSLGSSGFPGSLAPWFPWFSGLCRFPIVLTAEMRILFAPLFLIYAGVLRVLNTIVTFAHLGTRLQFWLNMQVPESIQDGPVGITECQRALMVRIVFCFRISSK